MSAFTITESESHIVSNSLRPHGLYSPWNSPGQNTGVGSLYLRQGIFPTQGSNPGLPHCGWILYQLSHKGSPRIPELVAYPLSSRSSWPRNRTGVSCIAAWFFTNWAIREALGVVFRTEWTQTRERAQTGGSKLLQRARNMQEEYLQQNFWWWKMFYKICVGLLLSFLLSLSLSLREKSFMLQITSP